jgi:hypothetical protein
VGFLAVFPFCTTLKVTTSVENSDEILTADIPAAEFFTRPNEQVNVEELKVKGLIYDDAKRKSEHFTTITLSGLTRLALPSANFRQPSGLMRGSCGIMEWAFLHGVVRFVGKRWGSMRFWKMGLIGLMGPIRMRAQSHN